MIERTYLALGLVELFLSFGLSIRSAKEVVSESEKGSSSSGVEEGVWILVYAKPCEVGQRLTYCFRHWEGEGEEVGEGHQHLRLLVLGVEDQLLQQEGEEGQRRILSVSSV